MKTWSQLLREGDPLGREPALAADEIERMRRRVLAAEKPPVTWSWSTQLAVASLSVFVVAAAAGVWAEIAMRRAPAAASKSSGPADGVPSYRRQLQFATPGGTRVIWVFDSNFDKR